MHHFVHHVLHRRRPIRMRLRPTPQASPPCDPQMPSPHAPHPALKEAPPHSSQDAPSRSLRDAPLRSPPDDPPYSESDALSPFFATASLAGMSPPVKTASATEDPVPARLRTCRPARLCPAFPLLRPALPSTAPSPPPSPPSRRRRPARLRPCRQDEGSTAFEDGACWAPDREKTGSKAQSVDTPE